MSQPYRPLEVANSLVEMFRERGGIEHMKLQKLLFYTYGWWLVYKPAPFMRERPEVWRYGPVFSSAYWSFNRYGSSPIFQPERDNPFLDTVPVLPTTDSDAIAIVNWVANRYGSLPAMKLSDMTHETGTPWQIMAERYNYRVPNHLEIDDEVTKKYFKTLAEKEVFTG